ncbi:hypothetical protein K466DRAFT_639625 [Polyporus arcularius HHB13444]|uniref:Uncharacterized protein n=1 Tax=Polyporus arcularius HHB13444 TaxID=1314778 RepID=A0A5C3NTN2_9APHY|nr:hypothetical protein K466DRAFT_639625 [Polyporus arcularius HHB13444]
MPALSWALAAHALAPSKFLARPSRTRPVIERRWFCTKANKNGATSPESTSSYDYENGSRRSNDRERGRADPPTRSGTPLLHIVRRLESNRSGHGTPVNGANGTARITVTAPGDGAETLRRKLQDAMSASSERGNGQVLLDASFVHLIDLSRLKVERDMTMAEVEHLSASRTSSTVIEGEEGGASLTRALSMRFDNIKVQYQHELIPLIEQCEALIREITELQASRDAFLEETTVLNKRNEELPSFLYRGRFDDYENTFEILEEPDYVVELPTEATVGVLQSKEWFEWDDKTKPLQAGTTLIFRVRSEVTYRNKTCYKAVNVSGDVCVRDQMKRLVKLAPSTVFSTTPAATLLSPTSNATASLRASSPPS